MKKILLFCLVAVSLGSCGNQKYVVNPNGGSGSYSADNKNISTMLPEPPPLIMPVPGGKGVNVNNVLPNATAFRMNGDFQNNVAITIDSNGQIIYFPDPTDITADSEPVSLGEGWWLNNQGIGPNSVFTTYTFAEYAALPEVPSLEQLKLSVIPGSKITEIIELPMKIGEANNNIEEVKKYIKNK